MTPQKPLAEAPKAPTPTPAANTPAPTPDRKPWIKKTPVEIVLEQITKQEKIVATMRADLAKEERELTKLQKAKTVLEA